MARPAADDPGDVAVAGCILRKHYVARSKAANRAVAGFNFDLTGEYNDVLPPRSRVIIAQVIRRRGTKNNALGRLQHRRLHMSGWIELDFDIFEVGFIVRTCVESDDLHQPVF